MYRKEQNYKFELSKGIFYTGKVVEEDEISIKIFTIRKEEVIINKKEIRQSILLEQNRTGEQNGKDTKVSYNRY